MAETEAPLVNKVAQSGIITLNLEDLRPEGETVAYDLKDVLFQGLILREKDFRTHLKEHDWEQYRGKHVAIHCSAEAIVPTWAYMLLAAKLEGVARSYRMTAPEELELHLFRTVFDQEDWSAYADQRVVLKGCGTVPPAVYVEATQRLLPHVKKLMFGEPCSQVPIYKKPQ